jgi:hypothetical protein
MFTFQKMELPSPDPDDVPHLRQRSYLRRHVYERAASFCGQKKSPDDTSYQARDRPLVAPGNFNVYQTVNLLRKRPSFICTTRNLARILQRWTIIGGYDRIFDRPLLSDRLHADLALEWGGLVNLCRNSESENMYQLMFQLGVIAFGHDVDMDIVRTLIAFSIFKDLKTIDPPAYPSFSNFRLYQPPTLEFLVGLIEHCYEPYKSDSDIKRAKPLTAKQPSVIEAARRAHEEQCKRDGRDFANFLLRQWPCQEPRVEEFAAATLDIDRAIAVVRPEWLRLFQNLELSRHIAQVQEVLNLHRAETDSGERQVLHEGQELFGLRRRGAEVPTLSQDLLSKTGPISIPGLGLSVSNSMHLNFTEKRAENMTNSILPPSMRDRNHETAKISSLSSEVYELETIIASIASSRCPVRQQYGKDLKQSVKALKTVRTVSELPERPLHTASLIHEIGKARQAIREQFDGIYNAFSCNDSRFHWLREGNLWPCITPVTLLEQLRSTSNHVFGDHMKEGLISYAVSITMLQRLLRMKDAHSKHDYRKLREEQRNPGHGNWQPLNYPDWLLLEIDANIIIRNEQVDVAFATISPASGSNSVLQMNMGQGK